MDIHVKQVESLFSAAKHTFKNLEYFYFHNCMYEHVWKENSRNISRQLHGRCFVNYGSTKPNNYFWKPITRFRWLPNCVVLTILREWPLFLNGLLAMHPRTSEKLLKRLDANWTVGIEENKCRFFRSDQKLLKGHPIFRGVLIKTGLVLTERILVFNNALQTLIHQ